MITTAKKISGADAPGMIQAGAVYTLAEVEARTGWSKSAIRSARRAGLPVRYHGGRGFIAGDAIISFLAQHGKSTK